MIAGVGDLSVFLFYYVSLGMGNINLAGRGKICVARQRWKKMMHNGHGDSDDNYESVIVMMMMVITRR